MGDLGDFLGGLAEAHEVGSHVDGCGHDGEWRATGKVAHGSNAVGELGGHIGDLVGEVKEVTETVAEITWFSRSSSCVSLVWIRDP